MSHAAVPSPSPSTGRGLSPLVGEEGLPGGVSAHGAAGINGRAARDEGMGLGEPAIEGQRGIEDVCQLDACGRHHIRGARAKTLHPSGTICTKEVVVVGRTVHEECKSQGRWARYCPQSACGPA